MHFGIWITNDLKPRDHVVHAVTRTNHIIGLIKRTFSDLDCQLVKQLFTSLNHTWNMVMLHGVNITLRILT